MARICSKCSYYNASGDVDACPVCQGPLDTTFLPPPGQEGAPLPKLAAYTEARRQFRSANRGAAELGNLIGWLMRNRLVFALIVGPFLGAAGLVVGNGGTPLRDRYEQIEVGMTQREVEQLLHVSPVRFGRRTSSFSARLTKSGSTEMTWREQGATIHVYFMDGTVVNKTQDGLY